MRGGRRRVVPSVGVQLLVQEAAELERLLAAVARHRARGDAGDVELGRRRRPLAAAIDWSSSTKGGAGPSSEGAGPSSEGAAPAADDDERTVYAV